MLIFRHAEDEHLALQRLERWGDRIQFWNNSSEDKKDLLPGDSLEIDIAHKYVGGRQCFLGNHHYRLEAETEPVNDFDKWAYYR